MSKLASLFLGILFAQVSPTTSLGTLRSEMDRLQVREALLVISQDVDKEPIWAPRGGFLAVNVDGKWTKVNLLSIRLERGTWHGDQAIGVVASKSSLSTMSRQEVKAWSRASRPDTRRVQARNGTVVELRQDELSTSLLITRKGEATERRWTSGLENCHSLALSPDEQFVAFIAELNGVVVEKL